MTFKEHFRTNFNIRLLSCDASSTQITESLNGNIIKDLESDRNIFKYNQITIKADPFLFVNKDILYLFYEEKTRKGKGYIMMTCTKDLIEWSTPCLVLREPFHLSFPFVFRDNEDIYMMPETSESGEIRIYKFDNEELTHCNLIHKPLKGVFVDSSIIKKGPFYFLFTSDCQYNQRVYYSDKLLGEYREHENSPVYTGSDYGRNAGSIISHNNVLYRPSQDCSRLYGSNVSLHRIDTLEKDTYKEVLCSIGILDKNKSFYKYGGHQFNIAFFRNSMIVATDALDLNFNVFQILFKMRLKLKKNGKSTFYI